MSAKIMPLQKLLYDMDDLVYENKVCCFGNCQNPPINSHTIPKNFLYKLDPDLRKVKTFIPTLTPRIDKLNADLMKPVAKDKFSTFMRFCKTCDREIFESVDNYDGYIVFALKNAVSLYFN